jgi:predicted dehydrogenase
MSRKWKVAGVNFDHMHMGDNLRMAYSHPRVELVALCDEDPARMANAAKNFKLPPERVFTDLKKCMTETSPDIVLLCPATAKHGEWTKKVAAYGAHIIIEKPFAGSLKEADAMIAAAKKARVTLAVNWPLAWFPAYVTAKRLIDEGTIGDVLEFHHYGGNRGPLYHLADKVEVTAEDVAKQKPKSWFYKKKHGGGSLLDYGGYGATMGTWFQGGRKPLDVTCVVDRPKGLEVDEHAYVVLRYAHGLSKFETRWGTFTDPWTLQPTPQCGFSLVGTEGTIRIVDYAKTLRVQTRAKPEGFDVKLDTLKAPHQNPVQYVIDCLEKKKPIEGPLSPALSRIGQQIVDTALLSAKLKKTVKLLK